jgi:hypothetical protein
MCVIGVTVAFPAVPVTRVPARLGLSPMFPMASNVTAFRSR